VTDRGIETRGYFNHFVPWHEIRGINTSGYGGSRAINDSLDGLVTSSGRRYATRRGGISTSGRRARLATIRVVRSSCVCGTPAGQSASRARAAGPVR
jgi:hypothetical protein